jgi:hypothetical protein
MTNTTEYKHSFIMKKHDSSINRDNSSILIVDNGRERKLSERSEKKRVRFAIDLRKQFFNIVNTVTVRLN